jgi:uncharacterized protein (TIGR03083 family)
VASEGQDLVGRTWSAVGVLLDSLGETDLVRPSRCAGWSVVDVVVHLLFDVERAFVACASPTEQPPTVDVAGYWRQWAEAADPTAEARGTHFLRLQASAYRGPEGLRERWHEVTPAAARAVAARSPAERVRTQGHVVTVEDLARSLVVEAALHHLDCLLDLPDRPGPPDDALQEVRRTGTEIAGMPLPAGDDAQWALKAGGRIALSAQDRRLLGPAADRFPLLG